MLLRTLSSVVRSAAERLGLLPHVRQHGAQHHRGAQGLQRVFRAGDQGRRRTMADALKRGEHFADDGAAGVERGAQRALIVVERLEADLRCLDGLFGCAQASGGVDQILRELAAVGADLLDFAFRARLRPRPICAAGRAWLRVPGRAREGRRAPAICRQCQDGIWPAPAASAPAPGGMRPARQGRAAPQSGARDGSGRAANHLGQVTPAGWGGKSHESSCATFCTGGLRPSWDGCFLPSPALRGEGASNASRVRGKIAARYAVTDPASLSLRGHRCGGKEDADVIHRPYFLRRRARLHSKSLSVFA